MATAHRTEGRDSPLSVLQERHLVTAAAQDITGSSAKTASANDRLTSEESAYLEVTDLAKYYGRVRALKGVSLSMPQGSFLVLLGPSGCGKTTTMRSIVGLEKPSSGRISLGGRALFDSAAGIEVPVHKRRMGMVFQSYAIWPHRNVFQNVAFPLKVQKLGSGAIRQRVMEALELVGLAHLADRGASELSGGQMQRVAVARSIVMRPDLLLLDEPLSNLDAQLRDRLRVELKRIQHDLGVTTVYVTHDQAEALSMADRIAVMFDGEIHQFATPEELYTDPRTLQVASFLGRSNFFRGRVTAKGDHVEVDTEAGRLVSERRGAPLSGAVVARVRVEDVDVRATPGAFPNEIRGRVVLSNYFGAQTSYLVETAGGTQVEALVPASASPARRIGDEVYVSFAATAVSVYDDPAAVATDTEAGVQ